MSNDLMSQIKRGEKTVSIGLCSYNMTPEQIEDRDKLIKFAGLGAEVLFALQDWEFAELMKRVDNPCKKINMMDLDVLVGLAMYGKVRKNQDAESPWVLVSERMPELENKGYYLEPKRVLCTDGKNVYKAYYVGYRQINCEDMGYDGDADCDEDTGDEYWPEGWYECASDAEDTDWVLGVKITHWMYLPELPEQEGK